jgi:hypothetical protein
MRFDLFVREQGQTIAVEQRSYDHFTTFSWLVKTHWCEGTLLPLLADSCGRVSQRCCCLGPIRSLIAYRFTDYGQAETSSV